MVASFEKSWVETFQHSVLFPQKPYIKPNQMSVSSDKEVSNKKIPVALLPETLKE